MHFFCRHFWMFFLLCGLLVGCKKSELTPQERWKNQILTLNIFSEPPTLDPGQSTDSPSGTVLNMLFEPLMRRGPNNLPQPATAESVTVSEDGKTYTFHLRESYWSNGDPVTAHDFIYAWKRVLKPSFPSNFAYQLYVIKGAENAKEGKGSLDDVGLHAPDDHTLVVELENPTPYFNELLQISCFLPIHQATDEGNPKWPLEASMNYVSNGPFRLTSWTHNNELVLERNPNYWDRSAVKLNKIILLMIEDSNTELGLFEDKVIDWTGKPVSMGIPTDAIPNLTASGRLEFRPMAAVYYYQFNVTKFPMQSANIRRAFAYAIDRQAIVSNITKGGERPATCMVPPPLSLQKEKCFRDHNIAEAQRLFNMGLKELGTTKEKLPPIIISYNSGEGHHKLAQTIQQQWKATFGIDVTLENLEWKVYLDKLQQGDFMIGRMTYIADYNDPYTFLNPFKYKDGRLNHTCWFDDNYNALLEEAAKSSDNQHRLALLKTAELKLIHQMPAIPVYFLTNSFMRNPFLKGVYLSPIGEADFKTAYFDVSQ